MNDTDIRHIGLEELELILPEQSRKKHMHLGMRKTSTCQQIQQQGHALT